MDARLHISPYEFAAAERLGARLGCSHVLAQVLVRRGLGEPSAAQAFLAAAEAHPLSAWPGLADTASRILGHLGSRITVHGDYDVDGICSTAILVRALRTSRGGCGLVSAVAHRRRLRVGASDRRAAGGARHTVADHSGLRGNRRRGGRAGPLSRPGRRRHRPSQPAGRRRAAGSAARASAAERLPVPGPVRGGRGVQARRRAAGGGWGGPGARGRGPGPGRARDGGGRRAAARREPAARARRPPCAVGHAQGRAAGAHGRRARGPERGGRGRDRLPARPAAERRRAPAPCRCRARAAADRRRRACPRRGIRARCGQRRAPRRGDANPVRGRGRWSRIIPPAMRWCSRPRAGTRA